MESKTGSGSGPNRAKRLAAHARPKAAPGQTRAVAPAESGAGASAGEADAVQALAALAQVMRLRVFRALVGAGPEGLTPSALAEALAVAAPTLSFHLKELVRAGLVTQQRAGRHLIYRPALVHMQALLDYLSAHCCQGAGSVGPDKATTAGPLATRAPLAADGAHAQPGTARGASAVVPQAVRSDCC